MRHNERAGAAEQAGARAEWAHAHLRESREWLQERAGRRRQQGQEDDVHCQPTREYQIRIFF